MIIPIDNKHRIKTDSNQWMLQKSGMKKNENGIPEIEWQSFKYYSSIQACVNGLVDLRIRTIEAEGIAEATLEVKRVLQELTIALTPHIEVE